MNTRLIFLAAFIGCMMLAGTAQARECYSCDEGSRDECKEKNPDTGEIAKISEPKERLCKVCSKFIPDTGDVTRGCTTKSDYNTFKDQFDLKSGDDCGSVSGIGKLCVCEGDLCNGSEKVVTSVMTLIVGFAALKFFL